MVHNKLSRNDDFFGSWSRDMAYILGFITADGCIHDDYSLVISIHKNDVDVLEYIKSVMELEHEIKYSNYNNKELVSIGLRSKPMYNDLMLLNVTPRKTYTVVLPPFIPDDMFGHYVRGVFDGDGGITLYDHAKQVTGIVGIKTASEMFARQLSIALNNNGVKSVVYTKPSKDIKHVTLYEVRVQGAAIIDFSELIYSDATFYMKRKYDKFQQLYNGRFVKCMVCKKTYYRRRIDQEFCDECRVLVRTHAASELSGITGIPSETICHALRDEKGNIAADRIGRFKQLLKLINGEDIVRSSRRLEVNNLACET